MFSFILLDAYATSSLFNKLICWMLVALGVWAGGIIPSKNTELKIVLRKNRTFLSMYKKGAHPASLFVESGGKFLPGIPLAVIYCAGIKQLLSIMHKRGFSDDEIINLQPDPGAVSATISEAEMRSIEACVNSELAEQNLLVERRMSMLGTITNCSTSLGLLGTVWGVMEAFMSMQGGGVMIDQVAPGISGALLTTVLGLLVSISGTIAYNHIAEKIRGAAVKAESFADELIADIAKKYKMI